ncbi:MAG: CBS domain-containing protein [Acetobacteraceae bacterium]
MTTVTAILKHKGHEVISVGPTTSIAELAGVLVDRRIGAVLVLDAEQQILGIVSERDIVHSLDANGARTLEMTAGQLMTRVVRTVTPRTTVFEAMTIMTAGRLRHLPVVDHDVLLGIVSIGDVVKQRIMHQDHELESLTAYVAGVA